MGTVEMNLPQKPLIVLKAKVLTNQFLEHNLLHIEESLKTQTLVKEASVSFCNLSKCKYVGRVPIN